MTNNILATFETMHYISKKQNSGENGRRWL